MYCIYQITNKINGKIYIGQHKYEDESNPMGKYKGSGVLLHRAYKKYGVENFETKVLYSRIRDKAIVDAMEIWAIEKYKPEYNIAKGGQGGGYEKPLSTRIKLSNAAKGRKLSDETKKKISEAQKGRHGISRPWTPEMREKLEGRKRSAEAKKRMSDSHKNKAPWNKGKTGIGGYKLSEETRKKMSEAQKGKHPSEETLKKLSESHKGKHWKLVDGKRVWS